MGHKGKEGGNKATGGDTAASGISALQLTTMTTSFNPKEAADPFELLDMCVEALQDRRGPTRELAMAALVGALEALPPLDELDSRCLTIFALCGVSIKKGSSAAKEARLAYRAVGLLALTLRAGAPRLLAESFPLLSKTVQAQAAASHDDAPTLVAALDCLAAVTFAGALDAEDAERSLKAIWAVIFPPTSRSTTKTSSSTKKTSAQVVAAAVSTWTFLITTAAITDAQRKSDRANWTSTISSLAGLLEHDDRAVRMAAGEALAVCVELNLTQHTPRKDMDALAAKVTELAAEAGGKGVDKKLLPEQKDLFRQIAAFLNDHGERPRKSVKVSSDGRGGALRVSTWAKLVQLNFLRGFLGAGFLKHVQGNALFKEAFCVGADEGKTLSIAKRKQNSKAKQKDLKVNRDMAWERKNVLCLPQDPGLENRKPEKLLQIGWH